MGEGVECGREVKDICSETKLRFQLHQGSFCVFGISSSVKARGLGFLSGRHQLPQLCLTFPLSTPPGISGVFPLSLSPL